MVNRVALSESPNHMLGGTLIRIQGYERWYIFKNFPFFHFGPHIECPKGQRNHVHACDETRPKKKSFKHCCNFEKKKVLLGISLLAHEPNILQLSHAYDPLFFSHGPNL